MKNLLTTSRTLLILLIIISVSSISYAQELSIDEQVNLRIKELDKVLNLNDKQEEEIMKIYSDVMERMAQFRGNRPARSGRGMGMFRGGFGRFGRTDSDIEAILTPEQIEKYRAFSLEQQIEQRMTSLDEMLALSKEQEVKIRKIVEQDIQQTSKMFAEMRDSGGDRQGIFEQMRTQREETNKAIEAVLTPEQVEKYRESMSMRGRGRQR